jgi:tRNA-specific 2-thiouridylase
MNLLGHYEAWAGQKTCCSASDIQDAREAAEKIGFDFRVFNFRRLFFREVIRRFALSYVRGLTPNPCLDCNRYLKFRSFLERARLLDCSYMATGHYARRVYDRDQKKYLLKKALDPAKDQSYVLYTLSQEELARILFPLGTLTKAAVRELAASAGLGNAAKPDSQEICFVREGRYTDFLARIIQLPPPGDFVDRSGRKLGQHRGIHHYTVGQRRGLGLPRAEPWYVLEIKPLDNTVVLGSEEELYQSRLLVTEISFIALDRLESPREVSAKIRYRSPETPAVLSPHPLGAVLEFADPQKAVCPGQAAVFYDGETVLGGGIISRQPV